MRSGLPRTAVAVAASVPAPVLALALTARRVGIAAVDAHLRLLAAKTWYLRRCGSAGERIRVISDRLNGELESIVPATIVLVVPRLVSRRVAGVQSRLVVLLRKTELRVEAVKLADVCALHGWSARPHTLAHRIIGSYPELQTRVGCFLRRSGQTDCRRNALPLLHAATTAHAVALHHIIRGRC